MHSLVRCSEGMYCKHRTRLEKRVDSFDLTKAHDALNAAQAARLLVQAQQHHGRISMASQASSRLGCMYSTIKHEKSVEPSNHPGALAPHVAATSHYLPDIPALPVGQQRWIQPRAGRTAQPLNAIGTLPCGTIPLRKRSKALNSASARMVCRW